MHKPNNYDNTQAAGDFVPLELGGHIMVIKKVEETMSKTGKDMLKISLDTAPEDKQPGYYAEQFRKDIRPEKKWGCVVYQLVYDNEGNTSKGFKTFTTSVEKSNKGFEIPWGDKFAASFTGKKIGAVFGREPYINQKGEEKMSVKCFYFRSVEAIEKGVPIPPDRELRESVSQYPKGATAIGDGFMNIPDGVEDDGLPFN